MTAHMTGALLEAEQRRCQAMMIGDFAALDNLLEDALQFHHSNGATDDKSAYLTKMSAGRVLYKSARWAEERATVLDTVGLITGIMQTVVTVEGVEKHLANRVLTVWSYTDQWRLLAFQSTPLPAN